MSADSPIRSEHPTVRVFVSSTFHDMHAERDHLVTVVFPELRERLERLGIDFFDVDLRWGLPLKSIDGERANAWAYCKRWIERVEPFFICLLGERYGWIPPGSELGTAREDQALAGRSITEMEIRFGALSPDNKKRSFFYFRNATVPVDAPSDVYAEFVDREHQSALTALRADIRRAADRSVRSYDCRWNGRGFESLEPFGRLVLDDLWSGVLRDKRYVARAVWRTALGHDPDDDPIYKDDSRPVPEELWEAIVRIVARDERGRRGDDDRWSDEFMRARTRWFQGRARELDRLAELCAPESSQEAAHLCVISGPAGQGKSALLARLVQRLRAQNVTVVAQFVGAGERLADLGTLLAVLLDSLIAAGLETGERPYDRESLALRIRALLERGTTARRLVFLIDGLDQLADGHDLSWLPARLGGGVSVVLSLRTAEAAASGALAAVMSALGTRAPAPEWMALGPLSVEEVATVAREFLAEYCKELDADDIQALCRLDQARNPLYLLVLLHELRILGGNEAHLRVHEIIASLANTRMDTVSLFEWFLENLEVLGRDAVRHWSVYVALGRTGMSSRELRTLLARKLGLEAERQALRIERSVRRYLRYRGDRLAFFHQELATAIERRYLGETEKTWHADLAEIFGENWPTGDAHALEELPYHLDHAGLHERLSQILTDLRYLHLRASCCDVQKLLDDYDRLGAAITGRLVEHQTFLRRHAERLARYPRLLFSLAQHEGFADLKTQADALLASGQWTEGWLRTASLPLPQSSSGSEAGERLDFLASCEYGPSVAVALAAEARLAFAVTRLGEISVVDIRRGRIESAKIAVRRARPLAVACSSDARLLAVAFDDGTVDVLAPARDPDMGAIWRVAATFAIRLPEFEAPFLGFQDHVLWHQQPSGAVARLNLENGSLHAAAIPNIQDSELACSLPLEAATLVVLTDKGGTRLVRLSGAEPSHSHKLPGVTLSASCVVSSQRAALAFSNHRLVVYDLEVGIEDAGSFDIKRPLRSMTLSGDRILLVSDVGRLYAWRPGAPSAAEISGSLSGAGQHIASDHDGSLLAVGELSAKHAALVARSTADRARILALFESAAPARFSALQTTGDQLGVLTSVSRRDRLAADSETNWVAFARDGRGHILAASITRSIAIIEESAPHAARFLAPPHTLRAAAGLPEGGFWLLTSTGDVLALTLDSVLRHVHRCPHEVVGAFAMRSWPGILVWTTVARYRMETVPLLSIMRTASEGSRPIGDVTTRAYAVGDGCLEALAYDCRSDTLITVWQGGVRAIKHLRRGRPEEHVNEREDVIPLAHVRDRIDNACFGPDGGFYLLSARGSLIRLAPDDLAITAVIAPSAPFSNLAEPRNAPVLFLVQGGSQIASCAYEGVDHA